MTEELNLEVIKARYEALDERMGKMAWALEGPNHCGLFSVYDGDGNVIGIEVRQDFVIRARADIPALVAEVERLRASLQAVLEEATSDFDRDIIITECWSALSVKMEE